MAEKIILYKLQPKQEEFAMAREKYVAYGGARGGGKSTAIREKAKRMALRFPGIRILIIRKTYVDLRENHIIPLRSDLPQSFAPYKEQEKTFCFLNGSRIKCSYFANDNDALHYQGQEYDIICIDEATQFSEFVFTILKACLRGANNFPKRIYLTCNPGGVGFLWVKRLFVSRDFTEKEDPADYRFIHATVDDNRVLCEMDPDYIKQLDSLDGDLYQMWRLGNWNVAVGQYFGEFRRDKHVVEPFPIPGDWRRYIAIDYGLDMLAAYWIAVDGKKNCYVYKELCKSDMPISEAAEAIRGNTAEEEKIYLTLAPPDLWNRSQETGKSKALIFAENGLSLTKSNNDREAGWLAIKELLRFNGEREPRLRIFSQCTELIKCLPSLMRDPKKPTDTMTEPHEITHSPDALRYFAVYWISPAAGGGMTPVKYRKDYLEDYLRGDRKTREKLIKKMGGPPIL